MHEQLSYLEQMAELRTKARSPVESLKLITSMKDCGP
ncbi:hypothetical protein P3T29_005231 [Kitasatospora sp. MAP5-34]|nr:hypothetical protein [Kitasatospora sp. MAP5-34]